MIGIVISYQMGDQLRNYGANIFVVNLLGLSVLREFGPLLTAILVAGRTGSAITAQLGMMRINQEIDSLNTMGITPAELLLLPRIIALLIVVPLLTIWADIFGTSPKELLTIQKMWGVLFQKNALFSSLTVQENIEFALRKNTSLDEEMIKELALQRLLSDSAKRTCSWSEKY